MKPNRQEGQLEIMDQLFLKAYAKINLALDVIRKRPDGYHDVRMIMQTIKLHDKIELKKIMSPEICFKTNAGFLPSDEKNLAFAAAKKIREYCGLREGVFIYLEKKIPVAAGMAGGSADAAAVLHGMNEMFDLKLSLKKLQEIGVTLGADIPYCLKQGTALAEGIGELLTLLPSPPDCCCLIVKPSVCVSTPYVYQNLVLDKHTNHPDIDEMMRAIEEKNLYHMAACFGNVLETVTLPLHPEIFSIKQEMRDMGAINALMSGSGPTVFGIFDDNKLAEKAFYHFKVGEYGKQTFLTSFLE